jgi:chemotaxis protein methyltransferase CheR
MPPSPTVSALLADPTFPLVKDQLIARTGLAYYADKDGELARHLAGRLAACGAAGCADYLALLDDATRGPDELDELLKQLTIGETFFFRHAEMFDALRHTVLPDLIARNRAHGRLRVWSAGCSTGAEAYSLSILLRRDLAAEVAGWDVSIVGTDVNREFLARAGEGVFEEWALRATPQDVRRDCFRRDGRSWALADAFKQGVSFQYHNLVSHPFPSQLNNLFAFDLILCRNVMIYFSAEQVRHCLEGFRHSLVEGGWLLVGHAEPNLDLFRAWRTVNDCGAVLYQKTADAPAPVFTPPLLPPLPDFLALPAPPRLPPPPPPANPAPSPEPDVAAVRACADRGEWEQALAGCRRLVAADRLSPQAHLYHGLILEQLGRHAEAEEALRRAIYLDRRYVLGHYYLGLLLLKGHRSAEAARLFRNALGLLARLEPGHVFADADGITAAELAGLARMQLDVLGVT